MSYKQWDVLESGAPRKGGLSLDSHCMYAVQIDIWDYENARLHPKTIVEPDRLLVKQYVNHIKRNANFPIEQAAMLDFTGIVYYK